MFDPIRYLNVNKISEKLLESFVCTRHDSKVFVKSYQSEILFYSFHVSVSTILLELVIFIEVFGS